MGGKAQRASSLSTNIKKNKRCNFILLLLLFLHIGGGSSTSNNLDQLSGNDSLSGTVVQNLVPANHFTGVLGGVLRNIELVFENKRKEKQFM